MGYLFINCILIISIGASQKSFRIEYNPPKGEEIIDIIWDEVEITVKEAKELGVKGLEDKSENEKIKMKYPKVVVTKIPNTIKDPKNIKFFNVKSKLIKEIDFERRRKEIYDVTLGISRNKKYLSIVEIKLPSREAKVIVLDTDGKVLWSVVTNERHEVYRAIPSPDGNYIIGEPSEEWSMGPLSVYYRDGSFKEIEKHSEDWDVDFSKNGDFFAVCIKRKKVGLLLILFDRSCNELWSKEIGKKKIDGLVKILDDDDFLIYLVTCNDSEQSAFTQYIFDKNGNLIKVQPVEKKIFAEILYKKYRIKMNKMEEGFYEKLQEKLYNE